MKKTVYKVEHLGEQSFCINFTLDDALETIRYEIEENDLEVEDYLQFKLSVIEMTEEEINSFLEFDGF